MATPASPSQSDHAATAGRPTPIVWYTAPPAEYGLLAPELASQLLREYTRPGDIVIDLDDDSAFAVAAAQSGRRHHALRGHTPTEDMADAADYIDLVLVHWPRPDTNPWTLLTACRGMLAGPAVLVIALAGDPRHRTPHLSALAGAAHNVGLKRIAHIAAFHSQPTDPPHATGADRPHTDLLLFTQPADGDA